VNARREAYADGFRIVREALLGQPLNGTTAIMYPTSPTLVDRIWEGHFQRGWWRTDRQERQRPAAGADIGALG